MITYLKAILTIFPSQRAERLCDRYKASVPGLEGLAARGVGRTDGHRITPKCHHFTPTSVHLKAVRIHLPREEARNVCVHRRARGHPSTRQGTRGQKLLQTGVCPVLPGADREPRKNSKQRVRLRKPSGTQVPRPVRRVPLCKWGSKRQPGPVPTENPPQTDSTGCGNGLDPGDEMGEGKRRQLSGQVERQLSHHEDGGRTWGSDGRRKEQQK